MDCTLWLTSVAPVNCVATTQAKKGTVMPRLYRVIVPVRSIETAVEFYSGLLEMEGERVTPGRHYFNLGGTILPVYDPVADGDSEAHVGASPKSVHLHQRG